MQNILKNTLEGNSSSNPMVLLLMLAAYVVIGLFIFQVIGLLISLPLYGFDFDALLSDVQNPYKDDNARLPLMITQAVTSIGAFIAIPLFFSYRHLKLDFKEFAHFPKPSANPILMTSVLVFCFMIANSVLIEWNQNITLPEFLSTFESWAREFEDRAEKLTIYLTTFDSVPYFILALFVIAVVPAVGEELLFRGLIQNLFNKIFKNVHLAIWVSSLLFALFHFQFYGVVPRMMLGVLFGYIYLWSGSLTLSMIGHFINNAFSLTIFYLSQTGTIDINLEDLESSPPYYVILLFLVAGVFFAILFRRYFLKTANE